MVGAAVGVSVATHASTCSLLSLLQTKCLRSRTSRSHPHYCCSFSFDEPIRRICREHNLLRLCDAAFPRHLQMSIRERCSPYLGGAEHLLFHS